MGLEEIIVVGLEEELDLLREEVEELSECRCVHQLGRYGSLGLHGSELGVTM